MTEQAKVPAIRFAGFTDPWEQRKFVDFVEASGIRNKDNLQLESYSVSNDRGFVPQDEQFENGGTMRDADKTAYWIVEPGSFAYNPARINVGSIGYQSTRKNVIVSSLYEVFKTDHSCDDRFLWHWFKSSLFTKQIEMLQEGGVRLYFFFDKLQKSEIWMPNVDEQRIIGQQFDQLDSLITLHQRKYDKLVILKKSMLEKMFPKDGESVPEIRFAGFTDPWEQRKLGEIVDQYKKLVPTPRNGYIRMGVRSHAKGTFLTHVEPGAQIEENELSTVGPNNLVVNIVFAWEHAVAITSDSDSRALVSHRFPQFSFHDDMVPRFFKFIILDERFRHHLWLASPSGAGRNKTLNIKTMLEYKFVVPDKDEQRAIGSFFSRLDDLITLHQRKLELLQNIKKSLLDKMFA